MKTLRNHVTMPLMAALAGTAIGCIAGCLLGRSVVLHQAFTQLDREAITLVAAGDVSTAESRQVLEQLNQSNVAACSPQDIASIRELIYRSHYLKAAGRMHGDTIACSTLSSQPATAVEHFSPSYEQRDGTAVYINLNPFRVPKKTVIAIRAGDSFVVYDPYGMNYATPAWMHFTVTDLDRVERHSGRLIGATTPETGIELIHEGKFRYNDRLYATHTSRRGVVSLTAFTTVAEALGANRYEFASFVLSGSLAGFLAGLVFPVLYRRNKGIEKQLLRALRKDALTVAYQPIIDFDSGRIVGAEALVRWTDEDKLPVPPDVFVRIAEEQGFVGKITRLVVRRTLRDFALVFRACPAFQVNVNIAAADLADPGFVPMLEYELAQAGVPASNLGIEITESYTARQQVAKDTINRLRGNGHTVHIDDFGTGFSSLAYLYELSVDGIKIDRAFVRAIGTEAVTVTILPQILSMARQLNLMVTVEGIETPEQAAYFTRTTHDVHAQGWLFGRAIQVDEFLRKLQCCPVIEVPGYSPALEDAVAV